MASPPEFDETKPVNGSEVQALELRQQFNSLKALIDAQAQLIATLQTTVNDHSNQITALDETLTVVNDSYVSATNTAANVDTLTPASVPITDPPGQNEVEAIRDKVNELIAGLHR